MQRLTPIAIEDCDYVDSVSRQISDPTSRASIDLDALDFVSAWRELDIAQSKRCSSCGCNLQLDRFSKGSEHKYGLSSKCKDCNREYCRARRRSGSVTPHSPIDPNAPRRCSTCGIVKARDEFRKGYKCKVCRTNYVRELARRKGVMPRKRLDPNAIEKYCPRCGETKPRTEWPRNRHSRDGLHNICKACTHLLPRPVRTDAMKVYQQVYQREYGKVYRKSHPAVFRAGAQRYRARKRSLPAAFTSADVRFALDYFEDHCAACGDPLNGLFHTVGLDHWIPLTASDCPGTVPGNMVPLCQGLGGCNNRKHNAQPVEWLKREFPRDWRKRLARIEKFFEIVATREVAA